MVVDLFLYRKWDWRDGGGCLSIQKVGLGVMVMDLCLYRKWDLA